LINTAIKYAHREQSGLMKIRKDKPDPGQRPPNRRCISVPVGMNGSIFISYRREEADDFAALLARELQRDGYRVFIDISKKSSPA
jgi:mitochondrial fission protein ELM1